MGGLLTLGSNSLDDIMFDRPNQSPQSDLKFLITKLYHINKLLCESCKAPLESAVFNSCLACFSTPGPSVVPVSWLAVPGRSKKWGRGMLSVSPPLQTPACFPRQMLVTSLIFFLAAGCRGAAFRGWVATRRSEACWESCLWTLLKFVGVSLFRWTRTIAVHYMPSWVPSVKY